MKKLLSLLFITCLVMSFGLINKTASAQEWPSCRTNFEEVCASGETILEGGEVIEWEVSGHRNEQ